MLIPQRQNARSLRSCENFTKRAGNPRKARALRRSHPRETGVLRPNNQKRTRVRRLPNQNGRFRALTGRRRANSLIAAIRPNAAISAPVITSGAGARANPVGLQTVEAVAAGEVGAVRSWLGGPHGLLAELEIPVPFSLTQLSNFPILLPTKACFILLRNELNISERPQIT